MMRDPVVAGLVRLPVSLLLHTGVDFGVGGTFCGREIILRQHLRLIAVRKSKLDISVPFDLLQFFVDLAGRPGFLKLGLHDWTTIQTSPFGSASRYQYR